MTCQDGANAFYDSLKIHTDRVNRDKIKLSSRRSSNRPFLRPGLFFFFVRFVERFETESSTSRRNKRTKSKGGGNRIGSSMDPNVIVLWIWLEATSHRRVANFLFFHCTLIKGLHPRGEGVAHCFSVNRCPRRKLFAR